MRPHLFQINAYTIETSRKVTKPIYNHSCVLNLKKREYTYGRNLIHPSITKFATNLNSLNCLHKFEENSGKCGQVLVVLNLIICFTTIGKEISDIILDILFGGMLSIIESLVMILRLADSEDMPTMGTGQWIKLRKPSE